ncbi:MAG: fumarylacetoacetate hydrolase family protein [bacterium]|jgi:2-keto-4-pentenoate hydratase/2-oxohepta-3-ene-1,7-dioic acid hydratase in catechol pathway|nr:fumarylacetoacetate hydrolase family protein [bacterium]
MRICRFQHPADGEARWGLVAEDLVREWRPGGGAPRGEGAEHPLAGLTLLAPVAGGRIFGIGRNYADHIKEVNPGWSQPEPLVFMKPDSALIGPGAPIVLPAGAGRVDYEGELALVIGRGGRRLSITEAAGHILGVTCANDVSARDLQQRDGQWIRAKGHDSFCPLGPWIETEAPAADLLIETWLNGRCVQRERSGAMLHGPAQLVAHISTFCTLRPGDIILTGTPAGVGPLAPGDRVRIEIEGVGALENPVAAEEVEHAL